MKKRTKILWLIVAILLTGTYLGLWMYSAQWFDREIDNLYANAQEEGVEFLGQKPRLSNFPFVPQVIYNGGIKTGNVEVLFPQLILRGYPIPFTTLHLNFPLGISLGGIVDPKIWSLDQLDARLEIPYRLPRSFTYEDLQDWQAHDGKIDVREYALKKESLFADGKGLFTMDENLQPVLSVESHIRGYEDFIREQQAKGYIEAFPAAVAIGIFSSMAKSDDKTGQQVVNITASVKNRLLTVGPLQVLELPEIAWDRRSSPDPRQ